MIGSKKRTLFGYLGNRLQQWHGKKLFIASRKILLKAIAQAIPSYCMQVFLLPVSLTDDLQKMMNSFWWGNKADGGLSINSLSWNHLSNIKENCGMGF